MSDRLQEEATAPSRGGVQARALIVTIYGLYAREVGGWLSISALIRLMAALGVEEPIVRSAISRLKRNGFLVSERIDGVAGYALSSQARGILREGDRRIFERPRAQAGEGWLMAVFSVPESERDKRHQLRSRLTWLGFGTVTSGVWIAPAHIESEARDALESSELTDYVDLFRADYVAFRPQREQVAKWWDLDALEGLYEDFVAVYRRILTRWLNRRRDHDQAAFADYVQVLTHWRRLPYLDPGLPADLLPREWLGAQAADIFFELHERLAPPAHRYVKAQSSSTA